MYRVIDNEPHVERDLALIKVRNDDAESRNTITEICDRYPARIVDVGPKVAIIEMVGTEDIIEEFIEASAADRHRRDDPHRRRIHGARHAHPRYQLHQPADLMVEALLRKRAMATVIA